MFGSHDGPCDIPKKTLISTLEYIRDYIKPDAVFYTGDSVAHDDDTSILEEVVEAQIVTINHIQSILYNNIQSTFAVFGNHDVFPFNTLDFENGNEALV